MPNEQLLECPAARQLSRTDGLTLLEERLHRGLQAGRHGLDAAVEPLDHLEAPYREMSGCARSSSMCGTVSTNSPMKVTCSNAA